jgi:electron transfer flavoprotein beta subunit
MGIKRARSKETREVEASAVGARVDEVLRVSAPVREKKTEMLTGTAEVIAAKIVEKLRGNV